MGNVKIYLKCQLPTYFCWKSLITMICIYDLFKPHRWLAFCLLGCYPRYVIGILVMYTKFMHRDHY